MITKDGQNALREAMRNSASKKNTVRVSSKEVLEMKSFINGKNQYGFAVNMVNSSPALQIAAQETMRDEAKLVMEMGRV